MVTRVHFRRMSLYEAPAVKSVKRALCGLWLGWVYAVTGPDPWYHVLVLA